MHMLFRFSYLLNCNGYKTLDHQLIVEKKNLQHENLTEQKFKCDIFWKIG